MYANQINLGPGLYGVEAASRAYFDKSAKELTLEEAAAIAAVIQTPARLSPFVNPDRTMARRNTTVLPRMVENDFITEERAREAAASPLVIVGQPSTDRSSLAPYFAEEIRKKLEEKFGAGDLYQAGLRVQTTLDAELQERIEAAAGDLGLASRRLPSGAGHDSQIIAGITRAGMLFVPSRDGRSHSPDEHTDWGDCEAGANVLLRLLLNLATAR